MLPLAPVQNSHPQSFDSEAHKFYSFGLNYTDRYPYPVLDPRKSRVARTEAIQYLTKAALLNHTKACLRLGVFLITSPIDKDTINDKPEFSSKLEFATVIGCQDDAEFMALMNKVKGIMS